MFRGLITALLLMAVAGVPYVGCGWTLASASSAGLATPEHATRSCCEDGKPGKPLVPHEACCEKACCTILSIAAMTDLVPEAGLVRVLPPKSVPLPPTISFQPPVPPPRFLNLV